MNSPVVRPGVVERRKWVAFSVAPRESTSELVSRVRAMVGEAFLMRRIPADRQKLSLPFIIKTFVNITRKCVTRLLEQEEIIQRQGKAISSLGNNLEMAHNFSVFNNGFREIETISDAIFYIEESISYIFPDTSIRIVLSPLEGGENPVAQMLADSLKLWNDRHKARAELASDIHTELVGESLEENVPLCRLVSLLAVMPGTLSGKLPSQIRVVPPNDEYVIRYEHNGVLTPKEIEMLDSEIFGRPWSVMIREVEGLWNIVFLSEDPHRYERVSGDIDHESIMEEGLETLSMNLSKIGKNEKNTKDFLTNLPLRRHFLEKANPVFDEAREKWEDISFALIDADHFKKVNDTYGHPAGDLVIQTIARLLRSRISSEDLEVRWGGEEFWVLIRANAEQAAMAMQRVADAFKKIKFQVDKNGVPSICDGEPLRSATIFSVTLSIGIAGNEGSLQELIDRADKSLYAAKRGGRDRIEWKDADEE